MSELPEALKGSAEALEQATEDYLAEKDDNSRENGETRALDEIPQKYTDGTGLSESDFVPNQDVLEVVRDASEFIDEYGLPNPDDQQEGAARVNELLDAAEAGNPIAPDRWEEIKNFHSRHRAQGNDDCDESSLPAEADEINQNEYDPCLFDPGYFSDKTWGGTPAFEQAKRITQAIESTEGVELSGGGHDHFRCLGLEEQTLSDAPEWDRHFLELHQHLDADNSTRLLQFTAGETPAFVKDRIRDAILEGNAVFSDFENLGGSDLIQLREFLTESLTSDGWTIDGLADQLEQLPGIDSDNARVIARSETQAILTDAREQAYEERGDGDDLFYWTGNLDGRETAACAWLIAGDSAANKALSDTSKTWQGPSFEGTNPNKGGTPVSKEKLKELIQTAAEGDPEVSTQAREWSPHIQCRKTFVRQPGS